MSNLGTFSIKSNKEYINIEEATGLTFKEGSTYFIQFCNRGYYREGEVGEGFFTNSLNPILISYSGTPIFVKASGNIKLNIAV